AGDVACAARDVRACFERASGSHHALLRQLPQPRRQGRDTRAGCIAAAAAVPRVRTRPGVDSCAVEAPDEQLMLAYRDGNAGAFETLYTRHRGRLYRFVLRSVKTRGTAEELFQEVWIRVIEA